MNRILIFIGLFLLVLGGSLSAQPTTTCSANFDVEDYSGSLPSAGGISFINNASGDFDNLSWDYGDGNYSSTTEEIHTHFYEQAGSYEACLSVWNAMDCFATYCTTLTVTIADISCEQSDCVYPGDADHNGESNLYDLLYIGLGYGANGPQRDNASCEWEAQPAMDWDQETNDGINYKHLDCDGNGTINEIDVNYVSCNYEPMIGESTANIESEGPRIKLQFDVDTIWIDDSSPEVVEFSAGLMLGQNDLQMENIYGLALYLEYDAEFLSPDAIIDMDYNESSFLGNSDEVIPFAKDMRADGQIDMALTRTSNLSSNGYGRAATLRFSSNIIIVTDIIDGRTEKAANFSVPIQGVKIIGENGEMIQASLDLHPAEVVFAQSINTGYNEPKIAHQVQAFPNPVTDLLTVDIADLTGQSLSIYNTLGQEVLEQAITNKREQVNTQILENGVYVLQVNTAEGIVTKRILIEK